MERIREEVKKEYKHTSIYYLLFIIYYLLFILSPYKFTTKGENYVEIADKYHFGLYDGYGSQCAGS